ncbi:MAG TPA: fibronectin type III domain-containing protein, partial [Candidatus Obscuribacterales bacterium]
GRIEGRTSFFNAAGQELGFVSWQAEVRAGGNQVTVLLRATSDTHSGENCPRLEAVVTGATILTAGGQVAALPGPATSPGASPVTTATPSQSPAALPSPGVPLQVQLVEQTASSLTLQWEFGANARSHKLYLDGRLVAENYVSPNYYRFEGLQANTSYRLGVQSVNSGGASEIVSLSAVTLSSGHSGSGNFSGGGGSRRPQPAASGLASTGEFVVNSLTTSSQFQPAVAMDADGDFVVVWSNNFNRSDFDIFGQRYFSNGSRDGAEFRVNTYTEARQEEPAVAMDADGAFVVTWKSRFQDGDGHGVYARRYAAGSTSGGEEIQVNVSTTSSQTSPDVAMDADGDYLIVWQSYAQEDGDSYAIVGRSFSAGSDIGGSEFVINSYTTGTQESPAIAMDADGNFVVVWSSFGQDGDEYGIFGRRFAAGDSTGSSEFQVNTYTTGRQQRPAVAMDADGDFVVSWLSYYQDGSEGGIYGRSFASESLIGGSEFQVNTYTSNNQTETSVAMDANGNFVITWQSSFQDGDNYGIFARRFPVAGESGPEFQVNTTTANLQEGASVALDSAGDAIVVWGDYSGQDGDRFGVIGRIYHHNDIP